ncbi:hypothetical protein OAS47_02700 [Pelagibacteraceae bacterium]|nr:hypothetical protein [Pelagibacteraceae bacterium]
MKKKQKKNKIKRVKKKIFKKINKKIKFKIKKKKLKRNVIRKKVKPKVTKKKVKSKKIRKKVKSKAVRKKTKSIQKIKKKSKISRTSKAIVVKIFYFSEKIKNSFSFNIDKNLQNFFQGISNKITSKINQIKIIIEEEKEKKKIEKIKKMQQEKFNLIKKLKIEKELLLKTKQEELKEELKFERERKKDLQKFIRSEQALVRKEQSDKQRKFLEQIRLEKKIDQFRKREGIEIQNLEKFVLSQERDSYVGVQERIDKIKIKYQALRDQKIRERVEQLGVKIVEGDSRSSLLEKEKHYNLERQKIEFALESFYRSAHSLCFQINKRYIPKYLSIMRVIDKRFETGEIFIKWDDSSDEDWLILIYIKDNSPDEGIIIEDKTNSEKNISHEFKSNEIFKASDMMVDSLTRLLDKERQKRKPN